jgi:hypothetical protein
LVVMLMTPFAASVPYSVAAAGPLMTSIDSISSGLMSSRRDEPEPPTPMPACDVFAPAPVVDVTRTPST